MDIRSVWHTVNEVFTSISFFVSIATLLCAANVNRKINKQLQKQSLAKELPDVRAVLDGYLLVCERGTPEDIKYSKALKEVVAISVKYKALLTKETESSLKSLKDLLKVLIEQQSAPTPQQSSELTEHLSTIRFSLEQAVYQYD